MLLFWMLFVAFCLRWNLLFVPRFLAILGCLLSVKKLFPAFYAAHEIVVLLGVSWFALFLVELAVGWRREKSYG